MMMTMIDVSLAVQANLFLHFHIANICLAVNLRLRRRCWIEKE